MLRRLENLAAEEVKRRDDKQNHVRSSFEYRDIGIGQKREVEGRKGDGLNLSFFVYIKEAMMNLGNHLSLLGYHRR